MSTSKRILSVLLALCIGVCLLTVYLPAAPAKAAGTTPMVAAGLSHSLALKSDGTVWAWGANGYGQLGNGSNTYSPIPVQVVTLTYVIAIVAGDDHSLALKSDGTVWAWGYNYYGQLGIGTSGIGTNSSTPVQVLGEDGINPLSNIKAIAAGTSHSLALKSDGTVWAWGYNYYGQLGDDSTVDSSTPVQVLGVGGSGKLTDVIAIDGGWYHSLALKSDGTVWAWGRNNNGQLGDGTTTTSPTPVQVLGVGGSGNLTDITAISAGDLHSLALKSDGTVWAWGHNNYGQLGDGTTTDSSTPVQVLGVGGSGYLTDVAAIAGGYLHSLALTSDGTVWAWGENGYGQLGDGTNDDRWTPVQVLDKDGDDPLTNITAISAGVDLSLALKSDGTVWAWGDNASGQLGDGTSGSGANSNLPVQVLGLAVVVPPVTITVSVPTTVPTTVTRSATTTVRSTVYNDIIDVVTSTVRTTIVSATTATVATTVPTTVTNTNTATATVATTIPTTVISATTAVVPTTVPTTITATAPTEVQRTATITNTEIEKEASNFPWWLVVLAAVLGVALVLMVIMYIRKT